jgi:hypothetical protein
MVSLPPIRAGSLCAYKLPPQKAQHKLAGDAGRTGLLRTPHLLAMPEARRLSGGEEWQEH